MPKTTSGAISVPHKKTKPTEDDAVVVTPKKPRPPIRPVVERWEEAKNNAEALRLKVLKEHPDHPDASQNGEDKGDPEANFKKHLVKHVKEIEKTLKSFAEKQDELFKLTSAIKKKTKKIDKKGKAPDLATKPSERTTAAKAPATPKVVTGKSVAKSTQQEKEVIENLFASSDDNEDEEEEEEEFDQPQNE